MKKKPPEPYFTPYPSSAWYWFDVAIYGEHLPHIGDLPTATFERLTVGKRRGAYREYKSRDDAVADLTHAEQTDAKP